jgi:predicted dehydrogenase
MWPCPVAHCGDVGSDVIELVALCESDHERLAATGDKFGIATRYTDMLPLPLPKPNLTSSTS